MDVKKGIRFQRAVIFFLRVSVGWFLALVLGFRFRKKKPKSKTYLLLANHNSDLDPVMVIMGTGKHARFVASANVLKGFFGGLIKLLFAPIPRKKGASADDTVSLIEENLKQGISVAMFPEGNKSWDGETGFISPRTARLVKESGAALVTYRLDGDYMKNPRWAKHSRKGKVYGTFVNEYTAEQLAGMSEQKVYDIICKDLYVDAYAFQRERGLRYRGKNLAEGLELTGYLCPCCKRFDTVKTKGNVVFCDCGMKAELDEKGFLHSDTLPFKEPLSWSRWEKSYLSEKGGKWQGVITRDEGVTYKCGDKKAENAIVTVFSDRIEINADQKYVHYFSDVVNMGAFRTTRVFISFREGYVELFKESGISGIKYFTLWRTLTGQKIY